MVPPACTVPDAGEIATLATVGAGAVTVSPAVPDTPLVRAVIVAVPAATPLATPPELTVAVDVLLLVHVNVCPGIVLPTASSAVAANDTVPPVWTFAEPGDTTTRAIVGAGAVTVTFAVLDTPLVDAVIVAAPAPIAVTKPLELT